MDISCQREVQITLELDNRPGILADLCAHLADHRINLRAMTTSEAGDRGTVRLVVDRPEEATASLVEAGVAHSLEDVLAIEMANHPGGFAHVARVLSVAGINIDFIYASATSSMGRALGIFGVSDLDRALELDWVSAGPR